MSGTWPVLARSNKDLNHQQWQWVETQLGSSATSKPFTLCPQKFWYDLQAIISSLIAYLMRPGASAARSCENRWLDYDYDMFFKGEQTDSNWTGRIRTVPLFTFPWSFCSMVLTRQRQVKVASHSTHIHSSNSNAPMLPSSVTTCCHNDISNGSVTNHLELSIDIGWGESSAAWLNVRRTQHGPNALITQHRLPHTAMALPNMTGPEDTDSSSKNSRNQSNPQRKVQSASGTLILGATITPQANSFILRQSEWIAKYNLAILQNNQCFKSPHRRILIFGSKRTYRAYLVKEGLLQLPGSQPIIAIMAIIRICFCLFKFISLRTHKNMCHTLCAIDLEACPHQACGWIHMTLSGPHAKLQWSQIKLLLHLLHLCKSKLHTGQVPIPAVVAYKLCACCSSSNGPSASNDTTRWKCKHCFSKYPTDLTWSWTVALHCALSFSLFLSLSLSSLSITLRCRSVQLKHLKVLSPPFNRDKIEPSYVYVYIYIYIYTYRIQYGLVVKFHSLNLLRSVPDCSHVWHLLTRESLRVPSGLMINLPC